MFIPRFSNIMAIVPIAILLTISFFVLLTIRKIEEKGLKAFGYVVVSFLWLACLVVFSGAIYNLRCCPFLAKTMKQQSMKGCGMPHMMQQYKMPDMTMPEKSAPVRDEKLPKVSKCNGNKGIIFKAE